MFRRIFFEVDNLDDVSTCEGNSESTSALHGIPRTIGLSLREMLSEWHESSTIVSFNPLFTIRSNRTVSSVPQVADSSLSVRL